MRKKEGYILAFCERQAKFICWLATLHIIKPTEAGRMRHPITNKVEGHWQKYETRLIFHNIMHFINDRLVDQEGKESMQRLINCGYLGRRA